MACSRRYNVLAVGGGKNQGRNDVAYSLLRVGQSYDFAVFMPTDAIRIKFGERNRYTCYFPTGGEFNSIVEED